MKHKFETNETISFMQLRINALKAEIERLDDIIFNKDLEIDQLKYDVKLSKSNYNMLVRNIEVVDEIVLQPIKK